MAEQNNMTLTELREIRIPGINNYTQTIINDTLILTPKKQYISEAEFITLNFNNSEIKDCMIYNSQNELISNKTKYRTVLMDIWKTMPSQQVIRETSFNIELTDKKGEKGFVWCPDIHMSVQGRDATGTMLEILKFVKLGGYNIDISIMLSVGRLIHFKTTI